MAKMMVFDMDGTIADLYSVPDWLEKLRAEDASPYRDAAPMWDMDALNRVLLALADTGWEIRVVSWLAQDASPEYKAEIRRAKREWLKRYDFPADRVHLVAYGTTKANSVRGSNPAPAILIDDSKKVRNGWTLGETIDPATVLDLPAYLARNYLEDTRTPAQKLGVPAYL